MNNRKTNKIHRVQKNQVGGEARPEGPKLEGRRPRVLGRGLIAHFYQLGGLRECCNCKLPQWVKGGALATNAFLWHCEPIKCIW